MKKMQSYRLETDTIQKISVIATLEYRTKSNIVEVAINDYYQKINDRCEKEMEERENKMKIKHNPGELVVVYDDPITKQKAEGDAILKENHRPDIGDGLEMWVVEFIDEPGLLFLRTIYE